MADTRNYPLMRKVLEHIEANPELHDQEFWYNPPEDSGVSARAIEWGRQPTPCGTTACIAGWAAYFANANTGNPERDGRLALGLSQEEATEIFHCYVNEVAVERLRDLIALEGTDG